MIEKIDHVSIIVKDLDKAIKVYSGELGLKVEAIKELKEVQAKFAFLRIGETLIHLIEPFGPGKYQNFLKEHGEGFSHICFRVTDMDKVIAETGSKLNLKEKKPRPAGLGARIAYLDSRYVFNVETELVEGENR